MKQIKLLFLSFVFLAALPLSGCILTSDDSLSIGSRNNTESIILSSIMGQLIDDQTDLNII